MSTPEREELRAFRQQVYTLFGCRRDALFELVDAVLTAPAIETPAHLSLVPSCQRRWGSLYEALNAGIVDFPALEQLVASYPLASEPAWYAVDASVWPRCDAETSQELGYASHQYRPSHGQPIVAGWNSSGLVQVPSRCASWTAPLRMRRVRPGENLNLVAAEQIHSWLGHAPPTPAGAPPPICSFDAGYDSVQLSLALADEPVCLLVRLRSGRCFYADPRSDAPAPHGAAAPARGEVRLQRPRHLARAERPVVDRGCRVRPRPAAGLERAASHPAAACRERPPRPAPCPPAGAPHAPAPGGRAPAPADQDARAPLVLVGGAGAARLGGCLAGLRRAFLDRAHLPLLQANPQVDDAQTAASGGGRPLDLVAAVTLCPVAFGP